MTLTERNYFVIDLGGNGKNADKTIEATRRSQADIKSVEAALHLQSQQSIDKYDYTDESTTLTLTEDEICDEIKAAENNSEQTNLVKILFYINHRHPLLFVPINFFFYSIISIRNVRVGTIQRRKEIVSDHC